MSRGKKQKIFKVGGRVKCLAVRFDGEPDTNSREFSENHLKDTDDTWVYETVKRALRENFH